VLSRNDSPVSVEVSASQNKGSNRKLGLFCWSICALGARETNSSRLRQSMNQGRDQDSPLIQAATARPQSWNSVATRSRAEPSVTVLACSPRREEFAPTTIEFGGDDRKSSDFRPRPIQSYHRRLSIVASICKKVRIMPKICITAALVMFAHTCFANDGVALFVQQLIQRRGNNIWFVEDDSGATPKGGYLYRFETDINGDAQDEVFVASSLDCDRNGELWNVFRKGPDGAYHEIKQSFFIGSDLRVRTEGGLRKFSFYVPQKEAEGSSYFGYFWLDTAGAWHDETHTLSEAEQATMDGSDPDTAGSDGRPDDNKIAAKLGRESLVPMRITKVLLAKYVQDANSPWRDTRREFTLSQQHKDPADASDIQAVANWTPPVIP
jgi:hypothetical protein